MFPFASKGTRFETSGADVDRSAGDGIEQSFIEHREAEHGCRGHAVRERDDPPGSIEEADLRRLLSVLAGGGTDHQANALIREYVGGELLVGVGDSLASEHVGVEDLLEFEIAGFDPRACVRPERSAVARFSSGYVAASDVHNSCHVAANDCSRWIACARK